jgi:hypothetical protein
MCSCQNNTSAKCYISNVAIVNCLSRKVFTFKRKDPKHNSAISQDQVQGKTMNAHAQTTTLKKEIDLLVQMKQVQLLYHLRYSDKG